MPALLSRKPLQIYDHDPGTLAPILDWVDPRFGPIRQVLGYEGTASEPRWWIYDCQLARPLGEHFIDYTQIAMGCSINGAEALRRALGEAVERYNAANSFKFAEAKLETMEGNPLAELFPQCAEFEQCLNSLKKLPLNQKITQVAMKRLADDKDVWVPAGYVHLTFSPGPDEAIVSTSITSGLAFHSHVVESIWSGLVEYAERDAIMSTWWNRIPVPKIIVDTNTDGDGLSERIFRLRCANLEALFFDVTSNFRMPTVFCILKGESLPYFTVGGSCNSNPAVACTKALDEAVMIRSMQRNFGKKRALPSTSNFDWVQSLQDRAELFAKWKDCPAFDFLFKGSPEISFDEFAKQTWWKAPDDMDQLRQFAAVMREHGMTALWSDITLDDVRELGRCTKVVIPEMVPLTPAHNACFLGASRLAKAAGKEKLDSSDVNPYPHPFP